MGGMRRGPSVSGMKIKKPAQLDLSGPVNIEWKYELVDSETKLGVLLILKPSSGDQVSRASLALGDRQYLSVNDFIDSNAGKVNEAKGRLVKWAESKGIKWAA